MCILVMLPSSRPSHRSLIAFNCVHVSAGGIFSTITRGGDDSEAEDGEKKRSLLQQPGGGDPADVPEPPRLPDLPDPEEVEADAPDNVNVPGAFL